MPTNPRASSKYLAYLMLAADQAATYDAKAARLERLIPAGSATDCFVVFDHSLGEWGIDVGDVGGPRFAFDIAQPIGKWGRNTAAQERRVLGLFYADRGITGVVHTMKKGKAGDSSPTLFEKDSFPQAGLI